MICSAFADPPLVDRRGAAYERTRAGKAVWPTGHRTVTAWIRSATMRVRALGLRRDVWHVHNYVHVNRAAGCQAQAPDEVAADRRVRALPRMSPRRGRAPRSLRAGAPQAVRLDLTDAGRPMP